MSKQVRDEVMNDFLEWFNETKAEHFFKHSVKTYISTYLTERMLSESKLR